MNSVQVYCTGCDLKAHMKAHVFGEGLKHGCGGEIKAEADE